MVLLNDYHHFKGRHWETGSVSNVYAYRGLQNPLTGQPYSEAFLLGVSGGIVMGYFSFAYQGYDPHVAILTRNTFDPFQTMLERLGVEQEILQTSLPEKAVTNLVRTLENGQPAITWVDIFSMPYFELPNDDDMYLMYPVVVYGYDAQGDQAWVADRASVPLVVTTGQLAAARGRVKKERYRVLTLGSPDPRKISTAVRAGIRDTVQLFTEKPPRGTRDNFGFAAYQHWRALLRNPRLRNSWANTFPPGRAMLAGLTSAFSATIQNGEDDGAERGTYASFLEEAAQILRRPALLEAAALFRASAAAWQALGRALLPDDVTGFGEIRALMRQRRSLFYAQGQAAQPQIQAINQHIASLKAQIGVHFPVDEPALYAFTERLCDQIESVQATEQQAVAALQSAMSSDYQEDR